MKTRVYVKGFKHAINLSFSLLCSRLSSVECPARKRIVRQK